MVMKRSCQLVSQPYFFLHSGFIKYNLMRTMQQQEEWLWQQDGVGFGEAMAGDGAPVRCKVVPQFVSVQLVCKSHFTRFYGGNIYTYYGL